MKTESRIGKPYPAWAPRFWHGMLFGDWVRLLAANRFRVHPLRWGLASTVTGMCIFNSAMARLNRLLYEKRIAQLAVDKDPIFILGHWRSGTTYLHELMSHDERFATPTTFQCFSANHFLLTESWMPRLVWYLMPTRRPMDNVRTGWHSPQEDEFALCSMGAGSPYLRLAFPNEARDYQEFLDLKGVDEQTLQRWQQSLRRFIRCVTYRSRKQLILKSPTHTGRMGILAQMFPQARFLHIVRSPYSLFPSSMKMWQIMDAAQALQIPRHDNLKEYVFSALNRMYDAFESQRETVGSHRIHDIHYEQLVKNPIRELRLAYDRLDLGDFEPVRRRIQDVLKDQKGYRTNRYDLSLECQSEIAARWRGYAQRYGYDQPASADHV